MPAQKKHLSISLVLALIGLSFFTPIPWNEAFSAHSMKEIAVPQVEKDTVCTSVNLRCHADSCKADEIDRMLQNVYKKGAFSGQVLYAENGHVLYSQSFGFSDVRRRRDSIQSQNIFQLASLSKPFTAVAIMQLYQHGKIDINQKVKTYLEDFPFESITVKNLLQHRSGLKNYIYIADRHWVDKKKPLSLDTLSFLMKKYGNSLDFKPDSRFRYCNTNYAYLAQIVEKVSGMSFADYFQKYIAQPLGMESTFVYDAHKPWPEKAVNGYSYSRRNGFYKRWPDYLDGIPGDKGLFSNTQDIFRFDQALYNEDFLADSIIQMMFTPARPFNEQHRSDYGIGFRTKVDEKDYQIVYHNGWWKGFRTYYIHDFKSQRTLIWLCNRSDVTINPYIERIFEIADRYPSTSNSPVLAKDNDHATQETENPESGFSGSDQEMEDDENYGSKD